MSKPADTTIKDFEAAIAELESIVKKLEEGDLALEASLQLYERGVHLSRFCHSRLEEADFLVILRQANPDDANWIDLVAAASPRQFARLVAQAKGKTFNVPGIVPPEEFVPQAENTSLSGLITYWVVDTVASEMQAWLRANPEAYISFNVPPEILGRGGLEYVAEKSGLMEQASQIVLEITERGIPDSLGVAALSQGDRGGVKVALDREVTIEFTPAK